MNIPTTINKVEVNACLLNIRTEIDALVSHGELNSDDGQYMAHCLNIIDTYINRGDVE